MKIYSGTEDISLGIDYAPSFINLTLTNLTHNPLRNVSISIQPSSENVEILTEIGPLDIHNGIPMTIPIAYKAIRTSDCRLLVLFNDKNNLPMICIQTVTLPESNGIDFNEYAWDYVIPWLYKYHIGIKKEYQPAEIIHIFSIIIGCEFITIPIDKAQYITWASINPVVVIKYSYPDLNIYTPDRNAAILYEKRFRTLVDISGFKENIIFYKLGVFITTLKDYLVIGWNSEDVVNLLEKISYQLIKLHIPSPISNIKSVLKDKSSLKELSNSEKIEFNSLISDIERQFITE